MAHGTAEQKQRIEQAIIERDGLQHLGEILTILRDTQALEYTIRTAERESQKAIDALNVLPDSPYKSALQTLAELAVHRQS